MKIKLAEALLRRKELQEKLDSISTIKDRDLFEVKAKRVNVTESLDDIVAQVPKLTLSQVMEEYNLVSKQLRLVDAVIQQANWTTEVEVNDIVMKDSKEE